MRVRGEGIVWQPIVRSKVFASPHFSYSYAWICNTFHLTEFQDCINGKSPMQVEMKIMRDFILVFAKQIRDYDPLYVITAGGRFWKSDTRNTALLETSEPPVCTI